jgi:hypothetical protein
MLEKYIKQFSKATLNAQATQVHHASRNAFSCILVGYWMEPFLDRVREAKGRTEEEACM